MELIPIIKKVKFRDNYWNLKAYGSGYIEVRPYKEDGTISEDFAFAGYDTYGETFLDKCKNAVTRADNMLYPYSEYREVINWDGDMDK